MGVITWNGSASTDYGTAANWSSGVVPSASSNVVIPDTSSINNCILDTARTVNSFRIDANGTFDGDGNLLTVDSEGDATTGASEGYAIRIDGIISGSDTDFAITTPAATKLDLMGSSGNVRHLTINHASCDAFLEANTTTTGNLTITLGKLTCTTEAGDARTLNVAGYAEIGPASGSADQATLTATSQDLVLGSGLTSSHALIVNQGGTFVGGSGIHTIGSIDVKNNSNAKCTLTSGNTTVNSEKTSDDRNIVIGSSSTFSHGSGTIIITFAGTTHYDIDKTINNLTLNHASLVQKLSDSSNLAGNLTITAGEFNANGRNLEVAGDVDVTGTLTGSSGALSFGSLTINSGGTYSATSGTTTIKGNASSSSNLAWANSGTFTHNSGTVLFDGTNTFGGSTFGHINPATNTFNNLTINADSKVLQLRGNSTTLTVAGDLTMTDGTLMNYGTDTVTTTVTGHVSIANGATLGANTGGNNMTAPLNFGSLTIASGGTFIATSNTTTLSKEADTGGTDFMFHNDGTFTHNNGKFLFDDAGLSSSSNVRCSSSFYDVELTMGSFALTSHHNMNVANDFTVTTGTYSDGSNGFTITGDVSVANGATLNLSNSSTQTKTLGSLTIASGATFRGCRGTTVITNETSGHAWKNDGGTFTHNNGKVKFDLDNSAGSSNVKENEFYDVEVDMFASTYSLSFFDTSGNAVTILNNLDLTKGEMNFSTASDTITIHGLTKVAADGTFSDNAAHDTNKIIHNGLVTNLGTYKINDGTTVKMNGGIRNLGTITVE